MEHLLSAQYKAGTSMEMDSGKRIPHIQSATAISPVLHSCLVQLIFNPATTLSLTPWGALFTLVCNHAQAPAVQFQVQCIRETLSCRFLLRVTATVTEASGNLERVLTNAMTTRLVGGLAHLSSRGLGAPIGAVCLLPCKHGLCISYQLL